VIENALASLATVLTSEIRGWMGSRLFDKRLTASAVVSMSLLYTLLSGLRG